MSDYCDTPDLLAKEAIACAALLEEWLRTREGGYGDPDVAREILARSAEAQSYALAALAGFMSERSA